MPEGNKDEKVNKTAAINSAIAALVKKLTPPPTPTANLTAYNTAIAAVSEANYTTASWVNYQVVASANLVTAANTQAQMK